MTSSNKNNFYKLADSQPMLSTRSRASHMMSSFNTNRSSIESSTARFNTRINKPIKGSASDLYTVPKFIKPDHHQNQNSKYHYHLQYDKIYGDKKLKLCGQCMMPKNIGNDLKQLNR
jgi:hypothetical protein